jgi:predicted nucleic acid-binding protein
MPIERIYWDSDAFLGWLQAEPGKTELCAGTLKRADQGEAVVFTSALTLAEVLWMRGAPVVPQDKAVIVRKFPGDRTFVSETSRGQYRRAHKTWFGITVLDPKTPSMFRPL